MYTIVPGYDFSFYYLDVKLDGDDEFGVSLVGDFYKGQDHLDVFGIYVVFEAPFDISQIDLTIRKAAYNQLTESREWDWLTKKWPPFDPNLE
jgi:hypothetical protein